MPFRWSIPPSGRWSIAMPGGVVNTGWKVNWKGSTTFKIIRRGNAYTLTATTVEDGNQVALPPLVFEDNTAASFNRLVVDSYDRGALNDNSPLIKLESLSIAPK